MFEIVHISEAVEHIETISKWLHSEWGTKSNYEFFHSIISHSIDKENLPQTFVALHNGKAIGTVGIWRCDMVSRQDLFPWLSALYVMSEYRNSGIGSKLQDYVTTYAKELGYEKLYLYSDIENYYEKNGWELIDKGVTFAGEYDQIFLKYLYELRR